MTQSRRSIKWNPDAYHKKLTMFFPKLLSEGSCLGQAHVAKNSIVAEDFKSYEARLANMYYGVPDPYDKNSTITSKKLEKLIETLELKVERSFDTFVEYAPQEITGINPRNKFYKLCDRLGLVDMIEYGRKNSNQPINDDRDENAITPEELKLQVNIANNIATAFLSKTKKHIDATFENSSPAIKRQALVNEFSLFNTKYPFISELREIEHYAIQVGVYLQSYEIPELFSTTPRCQMFSMSEVNELLAPLSARNILKSRIIQSFTVDKLQKAFDKLANELKAYHQTLLRNENNGILPFALVMMNHRHAWTVSYDAESHCWILIEANTAPKKIAPTQIGAELFDLHPFSNVENLESTHSFLKLRYIAAEDEWVVVEHKKKHSSEIENRPIIENAIQVIAKKGRLKKLSNLYLQLAIDVYVGESCHPKLNETLDAWLQSDVFLQPGEFTKRDTLYYDCFYGINLLHLTIKFNCLKRVQELLDVNQSLLHIPDIEDHSPLMLAANYGYTEMVELLLARGAKPILERQRNSLKTHSALFIAVARGHLDICILLIKAGADPRVGRHNGDHDNLTPLMVAAYEGQSPIVKYLLQNSNLDLNDLTSTKISAISWATAKGRVDIVEMLLATGKIDVNAGIPILSINAPFDVQRAKIIKLLLEAGAKSDVLDHENACDSRLYKTCPLQSVLNVLEEFQRKNRLRSSL